MCADSLRLKKLATQATAFSQNVQEGVLKMLQSGDVAATNKMMNEGMVAALKMLHTINRVDEPSDDVSSDKRLWESALSLPGGAELISLLSEYKDAVTMGENIQRDLETVKSISDKIGDFLAHILYADNDISDIDSCLEHHVDELNKKADLSLCTDEELIEKIVRLEFEAFDKVKNEGGRAFCQDDWLTFSIMRKSQYLTWDRVMLIQYHYDFDREYLIGHNLITEKYGRMMESTARDRYESIKEHFPALSEEKKAIIEQVVAIQTSMVEELSKKYPKVVGNARDIHTYEDNIINTSYETYLRGEISTYSDKMLQLYAAMVVRYVKSGGNIAFDTMKNTAILYGYKSLEEFEKDA